MRDEGHGLLSQQVPRSLTREGRILLIAEVASALLDGRIPSNEARMFLGSALQAFLRDGGPVEKHLRVGAPRGSHHRPHVLYRRLIRDEGQPSDVAIDSEQVNTEESGS